MQLKLELLSPETAFSKENKELLSHFRVYRNSALSGTYNDRWSLIHWLDIDADLKHVFFFKRLLDRCVVIAYGFHGTILICKSLFSILLSKKEKNIA